jgi:ATP-binding cassette subfamily F protein 3
MHRLKLLLQSNDVLLLDERITWILKYHLVRKFPHYPSGVVVVSHDKMFLDNVTNRTIKFLWKSI